MARDNQPEFTPEELVAELRARERTRVAESARTGRAFDDSEPPPKATATPPAAKTSPPLPEPAWPPLEAPPAA